MIDIEYWEKPLGHEIPASEHKSYQHEIYRKKLDRRKKSVSEYVDIQYWRFRSLDILEKMIDEKIAGKCMEIGSGQGLASAYLSSKNSVESVTTLVYSLCSLLSLLPEAHSTFKGSDPQKIKRVYGTYNNIKDTEFDYIFGFGAIHNSSDLSQTFKSIYASLKYGAIFMSSDMCLPVSASTTTEVYLTDRLNPTSFEQYGQSLSFRDTNDYFRNVVDYVYYAKLAGFTVTPIIFSKSGKRNKIPKLFEMQREHGFISLYPDGCRGRFDNCMLICQKMPDEENKRITASSYSDTVYSLGYYLLYIKKAVLNPKKACTRFYQKLKKT